MMRAAGVLCIVLGATLALPASAAERTDSSLHVVIARRDRSHVTAQVPLLEGDLRDAESMWIWTAQVPPLRFDAAVVSAAKLQRELERSPRHSLNVRVRGWSRREELKSARVIAAPLEMWGTVPEPLLPSFSLPKEGVISIPVRGSTRIRLVGEGWGTSWQQVERAAESVDVEVRKPVVTVELRMVSNDGSRIARGFGSVMMRRKSDAAPALQAQFATDDRGILRIPALPASEVLTVILFSETTDPLPISGTAGQLSRTVRLTKAGEVRGRLVDERDEPLRGARIEAEAWLSSELPMLTRRDALSDEFGRWVVRKLPRTKVMVRASAKGHATLRTTVFLQEATVDLGTIRLAASPDIALTVSDVDRTLLPNVTVTSDGGFEGHTNEAGLVTVSGLPPDEPSALKIEARGFATGTVHVWPPLPARIHATLERAFTVTGNVVREDGSLVVGAAATVTIGSGFRLLDIDSAGRFSIDIDAGRDFELTFESPGTGTVHRNEAAGRVGEVRDLGTIRLPAGLSVRGRIVGPAGAPIAGARIWAIRPVNGGTMAAWVHGQITEATSALDGTFALGGLAAGPALLRIDAVDRARVTRDVIVEEPSIDLGDIELTRGGSVVVSAEHADGAVARLDLRGQWFEADMITAPVIDGEAHMQNVPSGEHAVTVFSSRSVVCERLVTVREGTAASMNCPPPMIVRGRVLLDGTPAYGGSLSWSRPSAMESMVTTQVSPLGSPLQQVYGLGRGDTTLAVQPDGTFESTDLMAGEWQVTWRSPEGAMTPRRPIVVPDAAAAEVVLEFSGGQVRGRVVDEDGRPVAFARIHELQGPSFAMAADDGSFTLTGIAVGVHRLQASLRGATGPVVEVTVEAGRPTPPVTLAIDDRDRNVLSIQVSDAAGRPAAGAFVFIAMSGEVARTLTADTAGVAIAHFQNELPQRAALIVFALNSWAFGEFERGAADGERQNAIVRFAATGSMRIESRSLSGTPTIRSPGSADLSWMMARIGLPLNLSPEVPLVIGGLPPGQFEVTLGSVTARATVTEGSTATVVLP